MDNTIELPATENLVAGDLVNVWSGGVRKADCSVANQAKSIDGYVIENIATGATATVYTDVGTIVTGLSGLNPGSTYYLSTNGGVTLTPPTTPGYTVQRAGKALSAILLRFDPSDPVTKG